MTPRLSDYTLARLLLHEFDPTCKAESREFKHDGTDFTSVAIMCSDNRCLATFTDLGSGTNWASAWALMRSHLEHVLRLRAGFEPQASEASA